MRVIERVECYEKGDGRRQTAFLAISLGRIIVQLIRPVTGSHLQLDQRRD